MRDRVQTETLNLRCDFIARVATGLNHRAQFFVEQHRQRLAGAGRGGRGYFPKIQLQPASRRERHLAQRRQCAAVRAVVVGGDVAARRRCLREVEEPPQQIRVAYIRRAAACAELRARLRQYRAAESVAPRA